RREARVGGRFRVGARAARKRGLPQRQMTPRELGLQARKLRRRGLERLARPACALCRHRAEKILQQRLTGAVELLGCEWCGSGQPFAPGRPEGRRTVRNIAPHNTSKSRNVSL